MGQKYGNCWPKLFFWSALKTHEILRKQHFFLHNYDFFISKKIKGKSVLDVKKAVLGREIRKLLAKIIFLWTIKTHKILRKQWIFYFQKYSESWFWIPVLAAKTVIIFCIWLFNFRKNNMKVSFGCTKSSFLAEIQELLAKIIFCELAIQIYEILRKQQFFRE